MLICRQSKFHFHFHLLHAGATFMLSTLSPASSTLLPHLYPFSALTSSPLFFSRIPLLPLKILFLLIFLRIFISFESFLCLAKIAFSFFQFLPFEFSEWERKCCVASPLRFSRTIFRFFNPFSSTLVVFSCASRARRGFSFFGFFLCLCRRRRWQRCLLLSSDFYKKLNTLFVFSYTILIETFESL